jgi:hypothetical protein
MGLTGAHRFFSGFTLYQASLNAFWFSAVCGVVLLWVFVLIAFVTKHTQSTSDVTNIGKRHTKPPYA